MPSENSSPALGPPMSVRCRVTFTFAGSLRRYESAARDAESCDFCMSWRLWRSTSSSDLPAG